MNYNEWLIQVERCDGRTRTSLREQMAQLLTLRELVRQAEADRKKPFSVAEGVNQAKLRSTRPMVATR